VSNRVRAVPRERGGDPPAVWYAGSPPLFLPPFGLTVAPILRFFRRHWMLMARTLLLGAGLTAVAVLIGKNGPDKVLAVLERAAPWLVVLIALEGAWVAWDILLVRALYGKAGKRIPVSAWLRSAWIAYPFMGLLPAGRAGAEAARAAALSRYVGKSRAAAAGAMSQACGLLGNGVVSVIVVVASLIALGIGHWITIAVMLNMVAAFAVGGLIIGVLRGVRLGKLFKSFSRFDRWFRTGPIVPPGPLLFSVCGRLTQAVQYMFFVVAIGGGFDVAAGLVAQGVHLAGAAVGDLVPSQLGVTDGMYQAAAQVEVKQLFGLPETAQAAAGIFMIAMLGRIAQLFWSVTGALVPFFWKPQSQPAKQAAAEAATPPVAAAPVA
jgi:hypothetical protein